MGFRVYIKLREAIEAYKRRTGEKLTYAILAKRIGLAKGTLENIASRSKHGATLSTIAKICGELHITPGDLLELIEDPTEPKPKTKRSTKKRAKK